MDSKRILDIGCGKQKATGAIDINFKEVYSYAHKSLAS